MTRPSEAEVTEEVKRRARQTVRWFVESVRDQYVVFDRTPDLSRAAGESWAEAFDKALAAIDRAFESDSMTASLTPATPPLPSAEPVAWLREDGAATSPFAKREWPELNAAFTRPVYTTPPAAAQDTGPKDEAVRWLAILLAGEYDTEWQDAEGVPLPDLSQPCRHLLDAARAAGEVTP